MSRLLPRQRGCQRLFSPSGKVLDSSSSRVHSPAQIPSSMRLVLCTSSFKAPALLSPREKSKRLTVLSASSHRSLRTLLIPSFTRILGTSNSFLGCVEKPLSLGGVLGIATYQAITTTVTHDTHLKPKARPFRVLTELKHYPQHRNTVTNLNAITTHDTASDSLQHHTHYLHDLHR
jgi:hypothetical protein